MDMDATHEKAATLLMAIWRGVPNSYKSRYRHTIWQQFEDNIRAAAYTNSLGKFINNLCLALGVEILAKDVETVNGVLRDGQDRTLLKLMRDETTLLVLMVHVENQQRRAGWAAEQAIRDAEREAEEAALNDPLFGLPRAEFQEMKGEA